MLDSIKYTDVQSFIEENQTTILIIIFIFSFILRAGWGVWEFSSLGTETWTDEWDYITYAETILDKGLTFTEIAESKAWSIHPIGIGFPLLLAGFFSVFGGNYLLFIIFNAFISALIPLLIYHLGKEVFNTKVGLYAAIWALFYIFFYRYVSHILKTYLITTLFISTLLVYIKSLKSKETSIKYDIILSILYSYLIHVDERYFFYFPFILIGYFIIGERNIQSRFKKSITTFSIIILLMIPWSIRNYLVFDRPVILTTRTAYYTDKILGYEDKKHYLSTSIYSLKIEPSLVDSINKGYNIDSIPPQVHQNIRKGIKENLNPHNYSIFERWYKHSLAFFRPARFKPLFIGKGFGLQGASSLRWNLLNLLCYGILLPTFIYGGILIIKNTDQYMILLLSLVLLQLLLHLLFIPYITQRYRIPIDPIIILISFYGFYHIISKFLFFFKAQ